MINVKGEDKVDPVGGGLFDSGIGMGRGRFLSDPPFTPIAARVDVGVDSPAYCSTHISRGSDVITNITPAPFPSLNDPALHDLTSHIVHEVGHTLMSSKETDSSGSLQQSGANTQVQVLIGQTTPHLICQESDWFYSLM